MAPFRRLRLCRGKAASGATARPGAIVEEPRSVSAPFDGRRFRNDGGLTVRGLWKVIWWLATKRRSRWPKWVDDVPPSAPPPAPGPDEVGVTFVNHSTFLLQL